MDDIRIGFGTDIHRLVAGRTLVIGGVIIRSELGADGHSDADVLLHALTDALLGALALGDIGMHFPNNDERWKGAKSAAFVAHAVDLIGEEGYEIGNVDATIDLEAPKLRPYIDPMRSSIAEMTGIELSRVSIKAKTGEHIGPVGESRAVTAQCVVLVKRKN